MITGSRWGCRPLRKMCLSPASFVYAVARLLSAVVTVYWRNTDERSARPDAVLARLREKLPQLQVEYFPEKPAEYRLNHPVGALLLSYAGSRFDRPDDTGAVIQSQTIQLCVTVVFRQLNGKKGD